MIPVLIVLLAAGLRWGYLAGAPREMQFTHVDAEGYHYLAVNLLDHGVYSMNSEPPLRANNIRAPLYPLFVAAWYSIGGPNPDFVAFVQPLLDVLTVVVLLKFGTFVAGPRVGNSRIALRAQLFIVALLQRAVDRNFVRPAAHGGLVAICALSPALAQV